MTQAGQTVCLCMIVKNESTVLRRCLESAQPLIDTWLIVDTGSTDGTQEVISELLREVPGRLEERPWKDFGHNRSESVALARDRADYLLTLDADEYFHFADGFAWPLLTQDAYEFVLRSGGVNYTRVSLIRSGLPWRYAGILHEYITCDRQHSQAKMAGIETVRILDGARSRDLQTYHRDAQVLLNALQEEPDNARHVFYLAQSYRDAQLPELAIRYYEQRAQMGGFPEELWCSLYQAARLKQQIGVQWSEVQEAYLRAYRYRPWRAEPLYRIGLYHHNRKEYAEAHPALEQAMRIPFPTQEVLFVETEIYKLNLPLVYRSTCQRLSLLCDAALLESRFLADENRSQS